MGARIQVHVVIPLQPSTLELTTGRDIVNQLNALPFYAAQLLFGSIDEEQERTPVEIPGERRVLRFVLTTF